MSRKDTTGPHDLTMYNAPSTSKGKGKHKAGCRCCEEEKRLPDKLITKTAEQMQKNRMKDLEKLLDQANLNIDRTLDIVEQMEQVCAALKCNCSVRNFCITCNYCKNRFCTKHYLPEVHGCGEAAKRDYRKKYLHPELATAGSSSQQKKHDENKAKLKKKLRNMQNGRKKADTAKCCGTKFPDEGKIFPEKRK